MHQGDPSIVPPRSLRPHAPRRVIRGRHMASSALLWSLTGLASIAEAATFTVNATQDLPDALRGDGICETAPGSGVCTLRAALEESNALPGMDTVRVPKLSSPYLLAHDPVIGGLEVDDYQALQILDGVNVVGIDQPVIDGQGQQAILWARSSEALVMDTTGHQVFPVSVTGAKALSPLIDPSPTRLQYAQRVKMGPATSGGGTALYVSTIDQGILVYDQASGDFDRVWIPGVVNGSPILPVDFTFHTDGGISDILVADFLPGGAVLRFDTSGNYLGEFVPSHGTNQVSALAWYQYKPAGMSQQAMLLVGYANGDIHRYDESGNFVDVFASGLSGIRDFLIRDVTRSPITTETERDVTLFVSVEHSDAVYRFDATSGANEGYFVPPGSGGLDAPTWMDFGPQGDLYVKSSGNNRILAYDRVTGEFARVYLDGDAAGIDIGSFDFRDSVSATPTFGPGSNLFDLTLQNGVTTAIFGIAGGFTNDGSASTTLHRVNVLGSSAVVYGAGIRNRGSLAIYESTIANNEMSSFGGGGDTSRGGGIYNSGDLLVERSLIRGNFAGKGGGIAVQGSSASARVFNSTITENRSNAEGGGIGSRSGNISIQSSTITKNTTNIGGSAENFPYGGGLFVGDNATASIGNSILADNSDSGESVQDSRSPSDPFYSPDCWASNASGLLSYRNNIIGELNANCDIGDYNSGDLTGNILYGPPGNPIDPGLGPLADNGGPTLTYAIAPGSIAIDGVVAGSPLTCSSDQREAPRPADGNGDGTAICDIGAFEYIPETQYYLLEAEDALLSGAYAALGLSQASGQFYVGPVGSEVNEPSAPNPAHRIEFDVYVTTPGFYNIAGWVRASAPDDNSFWVQVNDGSPVLWDLSGTNGAFVEQLVSHRGNGDENNPEVDPVVFELEQGYNTITFFLREHLSALDRIAILPAGSPVSSLLSQAQPANASSVFSSSFLASYAFDGNLSTRWASQINDDEWLEVELDEPTAVSRVVLRWAAGYARQYELQISDDRTTWRTLYTQANGNGGVEDVAVTGTGRYVRMRGIERGTPNTYSLYELEVYGAPLEPSGANLTASYNVFTDWGQGYCLDLSVTNPSSQSVSDWSVVIDMNGATIRPDHWNGSFSGSSGVVTVGPGFEWNATIPPGETESTVGFCALRSNPNSGTLPIILGTQP